MCCADYSQMAAGRTSARSISAALIGPSSAVNPVQKDGPAKWIGSATPYIDARHNAWQFSSSRIQRCGQGSRDSCPRTYGRSKTSSIRAGELMATVPKPALPQPSTPQGWRDEVKGRWPELFRRLDEIQAKLVRATNVSRLSDRRRGRLQT